MHVHRRSKLQRSADKIAGGRSSKDKSLAGDPLTWTEDTADGTGARLSDGTESLFYNVGQPTALVARGRIRTAIHRATLKIFVVPRHFADEVVGYLWRCDTGDQ